MDLSQLDTLVDAAKRQDPEALGSLCERFYPPVYRFILHKVRRKEDAEDLASEVCVRVVESLPNQAGSFAAWVFRIARNLITDFYRRGAVRQEVALSDGVAETLAGPVGRDGLPVLSHQLERALAILTPEQREVLHLRFVEELDAEEIGEIQGRTAGAVRALQFRALGTLRGALAPSGGD
ncbi:MAG: sigma-70 family RNA polymerase sigma factor [Thermoanaerobaculia bacterium]|nr:MAG: sigma-70 family RNA polymerase sigma factor [Thermoanaerobaculia bacterium]